MSESGRRVLTLETIEAIMPEVDRLLAGHRTVGQWSLGAICDHLARTVALTLSAPPAAEPTREQTVLRRLFFRQPRFPEGQPFALSEQAPDLHADPTTAAEALRRALSDLAAYHGPWPSHPRIGPLTRDEWLLFHARHAAHHLGFAVPG